MKCTTFALLALALTLASIFPAARAIVHVPGDAPTIQAGINLAVPPDTVLVAPGVYPEHIQLRSSVAVIGADARTTIIDGGGVPIDVVRSVSVHHVMLRGFTIQGAISGGGLPGGAGVFINFPEATVLIQDVIATRNDFGIAIFNGYTHGGPNITDCRMAANNFYGLSDPGNGLVSGCMIYENHVAGIFQWGNSTSPQIIGNTIWGNPGHGYWYWNDFAPLVRDNIFALNGGYGIREHAPGTFVDPIVEYNLFWMNSLGNYYDVQSGTVKNTEPEINGMSNAEHNLVADPLLCDAPADFDLCADSPALGAGFGGADIGAGALGCDACGPMSVHDAPALDQNALHLSASPNPAAAMTVCFELPTSAQTRVRVYQSDGRLVRTLLEATLAAGPQRIAWDGRDERGTRVAAGIYLIDVSAGEMEVARKVAVVAEP